MLGSGSTARLPRNIPAPSRRPSLQGCILRPWDQDSWRGLPNGASLELGHASAFPGLTLMLPRPKLAILCSAVETPCLERSLSLPVAYIWVSSSVITLVHSWPEPSALPRPRTHQIEYLVQKRLGTFSAESSPLHGRPHLSHLQDGQEGAPEDKLWFVPSLVLVPSRLSPAANPALSAARQWTAMCVERCWDEMQLRVAATHTTRITRT